MSSHINFKSFIKELKLYSQDSIVNNGRIVLWENFKNKLSSRQKIVLSSYGYQVIILSKIYSNNEPYYIKNLKAIPKNICNDKVFIDLCERYFAIFVESLFEKRHNIGEKIACFLDDSRNKDNIIPLEYRKNSYLTVNLETEIHISQLPNINASLESVYRCHAVLDILVTNLKEREKKQKKPDIDKISDINNILKYIKDTDKYFSATMLTFSQVRITNGIIGFYSPSRDKSYKIEELGIDFDHVALLVKRIAIDLSEIEYKEISIDDLQNFVKKYPIIEINKNEYIIYSPKLYLAYCSTNPLLELANNYSSKHVKDGHSTIDIPAELGSAYEEHIKDALENIFGKNKVKRFREDNEQKKADFYIKFDKCTILIEVKKTLGYCSQDPMNPEAIASTYQLLYGACKQCSNSIEALKNENNNIFPIITIIIVIEDIGLKSSSFHNFAKKSGLLNDLGIDYIKIVSWDSFEEKLSTTSVNEFISALLIDREQYLKKDSLNRKDFYLPKYKTDTRAHNYEHLNKAKEYLDFAKEKFRDSDALRDERTISEIAEQR